MMKSVGKPYEGKLHVRFDEGKLKVTHPPVKTGGFLTPLEEVTTRVLHKWSFLKDRQPLIARYFISFSSF